LKYYNLSDKLLTVIQIWLKGSVMQKDDEKKQRILKIAKSFFSHFGLKKTTMHEIAHKARMAKSTLYYYFKNKEEIFSEVIRKESLILKEQITEQLGKANTPQEKLRAYIHTRMDRLNNLSNYYSTLTDEYLEHYSFVNKARTDFNIFEQNTISKILSDGCDSGVFKIPKVASTSRSIIIVLKGLEIPLLMRGENVDMDKIIDDMLLLLFKGIVTR